MFRTKDLYFAAYLKVAALTYVGTEREGAQVTWVFEHPGRDVLGALRHQFYADTARVPALSFVQAIKDLKRSVYRE